MKWIFFFWIIKHCSLFKILTSNSPQLYFHTGIAFSGPNSTTLNSLCVSNSCGPTCNCTFVPDSSFVYSSCSGECCTDDFCYRTTLKSGIRISESQQFMAVFGGIYNSDVGSTNSCQNQFGVACNEILSNDIYILSVSANPQWNKIDIPSPKPSPRLGSSSIIFEEIDGNILRKKMLILGGMGKSCSGVCSDAWIYEIPWAPQAYYTKPTPFVTANWNRGNIFSQISFSSASPLPRVFSAMACDSISKVVYMFGGLNATSGFTNDLWKLHLQNMTWENIKYKVVESAVRSLKLWDGSIFSFSVPLNKLNGNWDTSKLSLIPNQSVCTNYSDIPPCLAGASLSYYNGKLVLSGGSNDGDSDFYYNEIVWEFDIGTLVWSKPLNLQSKQKMSFSAGTLFKDYAFSFGGFNLQGLISSLQFWNLKAEITRNFDSNSGNNVGQLAGAIMVKYDGGLLLQGGMKTQGEISSLKILEFQTVCKPVFESESLNLTNATFYQRITKFISTQNSCFKIIFSKFSSPFQYLVSNNTYVFEENGSCSGVQGSGCVFGQLKCPVNKFGSTCNEAICPNTYCFTNEKTLTLPHCIECSNHGKCKNGTCVCDAGWSSSTCGVKNCQNNCTSDAQVNNGICLQHYPLASCRCNLTLKREGNWCSSIYCFNNCTNRGKCSGNGICNCSNGYNGSDCSIIFIDLLNFGFRIKYFVVISIILFLV